MRESQSTAELQVGGRPRAIGQPVSDNGRQSEAAVAQTRKKGASLKLPGGGLTIFSLFYQRRFYRLSQHSTLGGKALWEPREASHALIASRAHTASPPSPPSSSLMQLCHGHRRSIVASFSVFRSSARCAHFFFFFSISRPRHEALLK